MELKPSSIQGGDVPSYYGEDKIPEAKKLTFANPYHNVDSAVVTFDENQGSIFVKLDSLCEVRLKRTRKVVLASNFKGKKAIDGAKIQPALMMSTDRPVLTQSVIQSSSAATGDMWVGQGEYGCVYLNARPAEIRMTMLMGPNSSKLTLFQKRNNGTEASLFSVDAAHSPTNLIRLKAPHPDIADVLVSINKSQNLVFAKIGNNCEIQLTQSTTGRAPTSAAKLLDPVAASVASLPAVKQQMAPIVPKTLKRLQGNWTGFEGHGCIDIGSWPAAVTASAQVKEDIFQLNLEYETTWYKGSYGYHGEGKIPTSHKLVFEKPFQETNEAVVRFDENNGSIYVILDTTCEIRLKRTNKRTIPADFKGKSPFIEEASLRSQ